MRIFSPEGFGEWVLRALSAASLDWRPAPRLGVYSGTCPVCGDARRTLLVVDTPETGTQDLACDNQCSRSEILKVLAAIDREATLPEEAARQRRMSPIGDASQTAPLCTMVHSTSA